MQLDPIQLIVLLAAGLVAGFVNTLAGGGSLLTIPALIFAGLPSTVANATNRVAVLLQTLVGSVQFHRKGKLDIPQAARLAVPALGGAVVGAFIAAEIPREIFDPILGVLLLVILATLFLRPRKSVDSSASPTAPPVVRVLVFFGIGIYGGFIQAGVGFFLIAAITWMLGLDLVRTNAIKVTIVLLFTAVSLAIFAFYGQVMWLHGLVLAVGNMSGALIGVRFALKRGAGAIRWIIALAVVASALKLFGVLPF